MEADSRTQAGPDDEEEETCSARGMCMNAFQL